MLPCSLSLSQPSPSLPKESIPFAPLTNNVMTHHPSYHHHHHPWSLLPEFSSPFMSEPIEGTYPVHPIHLDNNHNPIYPPHDPSRSHDPFMFYSSADPSLSSPFLSSYSSPIPFASSSFDTIGNSEWGGGVDTTPFHDPYAAPPAAPLPWDFGNHFPIDPWDVPGHQAPMSGDALYGIFEAPFLTSPPPPPPPHSTSPCPTPPMSFGTLSHGSSSAPSTPYLSSPSHPPQEPVPLHHPRPQRPISVSHLRVASPVPGPAGDPGSGGAGGVGLSPLSLLCQPVSDSVLLEACKPFAGAGSSSW